MLETLNGLAQYHGYGCVERQSIEHWLKICDAGRSVQPFDQVFQVLAEAFKVLVLHLHELPPENFPRVFPGSTVLGKDSFTDHSPHSHTARSKMEI